MQNMEVLQCCCCFFRSCPQSQITLQKNLERILLNHLPSTWRSRLQIPTAAPPSSSFSPLVQIQRWLCSSSLKTKVMVEICSSLFLSDKARFDLFNHPYFIYSSYYIHLCTFKFLNHKKFKLKSAFCLSFYVFQLNFFASFCLLTNCEIFIRFGSHYLHFLCIRPLL